MNLISDRLSTASIKYFNWPSPVFGRFQNRCNKVVIEFRVVQFWSEIMLVISNRTRAAHSFNFEITRMISAQIALLSVQLPLYIHYWLKEIPLLVNGVKSYNMYILQLIEITHLVTGIKSFSMYICQGNEIMRLVTGIKSYSM